MISRWTRLRMLLFGVLVALGALAIARRAFVLQVEQADLLRERAEDQSLREIEVRPQRGRILDRNGHELASTAELDSVSCNPRVLHVGARAGSERLAAALRLEAAPLERTLERASEARRYFAWIKRTVTPEESARVRALALPGVRLTREPARIYPQQGPGRARARPRQHRRQGGRGGGAGLRQLPARHAPAGVRGVKDGSGRDLLIDGLVDPQEHRRRGRRADPRHLPHARHRRPRSPARSRPGRPRAGSRW